MFSLSRGSLKRILVKNSLSIRNFADSANPEVVVELGKDIFTTHRKF
jgi:hypothetical protein